MAQLLFNLIQSTNPCEDCEGASAEESMTLSEWEGSAFGVPGSRICGDNCHCLLVPDGTELPTIGDDLLRGDKGTDIPKITDTFPLELKLEELSVLWRAKFGAMKSKHVKMNLQELVAELESDLGLV